MGSADDTEILTMCDELFSEPVELLSRVDLAGARDVLATALESNRERFGVLLRGPKAFYLRKACRDRLRRAARSIAGVEGEIPPSEQHTFGLWVTSAYALCANWVLGGCRTSRETFLRHLSELDERLLGA